MNPVTRAPSLAESRVAESGLVLIGGDLDSAPSEDVKLKSR